MLQRVASQTFQRHFWNCEGLHQHQPKPSPTPNCIHEAKTSRMFPARVYTCSCSIVCSITAIIPGNLRNRCIAYGWMHWLSNQTLMDYQLKHPLLVHNSLNVVMWIILDQDRNTKLSRPSLHTSLVFDHLQYFPPSIFAYFKQFKTGGWWGGPFQFQLFSPHVGNLTSYGSEKPSLNSSRRSLNSRMISLSLW